MDVPKGLSCWLTRHEHVIKVPARVAIIVELQTSSENGVNKKALMQWQLCGRKQLICEMCPWVTGHKASGRLIAQCNAGRQRDT